MPSYTPRIPSGSANGRLIAIGTGSTTLHDSTTVSTHMDEVFVYVNNTTSAAIVVTLEIEGTAAANQIIDSIPAKAGAVLMLAGMRCNNTTNIDAKAVSAGCNAMVIVNRITLTEAI